MVTIHRTDASDPYIQASIAPSLAVGRALAILTHYGEDDLAFDLTQYRRPREVARLGVKIRALVQRRGRRVILFPSLRREPMAASHRAELIVVAGWLCQVGKANCSTYITAPDASPVASEANPVTPRAAPREKSHRALPASFVAPTPPVRLRWERRDALPHPLSRDAGTMEGGRMSPMLSVAPRGDPPVAQASTMDNGPSASPVRGGGVRVGPELGSKLDDVLAHLPSLTPASPSLADHDVAGAPEAPGAPEEKPANVEKEVIDPRVELSPDNLFPPFIQSDIWRGQGGARRPLDGAMGAWRSRCGTTGRAFPIAFVSGIAGASPRGTRPLLYREEISNGYRDG